MDLSLTGQFKISSAAEGLENHRGELEPENPELWRLFPSHRKNPERLSKLMTGNPENLQ